MDTLEEECKAKIFYYFRESYYTQMLEISKNALTKYKSNKTFHLLYSLSLALNNRLEESINELDTIKSENDVNLAVIIALMYVHKLLKNGIDKEIYQKLDSEMKDLRKNASSKNYYNSAVVLFVFNKLDKSIDYIDKALNIESNFTDALVLKGWTLLQIHKKNQKQLNTKDYFECDNFIEKKHLDGALGFIESCIYQNKYDEALNVSNKIITKFPNCHLPLIYKMKVQFCIKEWEQVIETLNRIINLNANDLDALRMNIIILLCRDANYDEAVICMEKFINCLQTKENKNGKVIVENAKLFSKICGYNTSILNLTFTMVENIVQIYSDHSEFVTELGYQALKLGKIPDALRFFKMATKIDDTFLDALIGLVLCDLKQKDHENIQKQIDYLMDLEGAQSSSILYFIKAQIANNKDESLDYLKKACDLHLSKIKSIPYSEYYLLLLEPDYILDVVREAMNYLTSDNIKGVNFVQNILLTVCKACPGLYDASFLLARLQFLKGDLTNAMNTLEKILDRNESNSNANLLMAQIQIQNGLYERAAQSLEIGLSNNFQVRDDPLYHYLKGLVDKNDNNLPDAIKSLTTALGLAQTDTKISKKDKSSIYIELIDINNSIGATEEAKHLLELALNEFKNTSEEARILIMNSDQALKNKDIQKAIDLLNRIKPNENYYLQAKHKLADILLNQRKDRFAYLECYQEMVNENPGSDSYLLLGDAYMNVLEPDEALEAYNKALQINPSDITLIQKMGKALIETHYYARSVEFYKQHIDETNNPDLKLQLADLYIKLSEYKKAEALLLTEIDNQKSKDFEDLTHLQYKSKLLTLLAQTQEKSGNLNGALTTLKNAKENQNRVRKRFVVEQNNVPDNEIQLYINICLKSADLSIVLKDNNQAIQLYKDALDVKNNDIDVMTALGKLYMKMNYLEPCQQICSSILKLDPNNEEAAVIMADIAFRKIDFDMALFHFTQLIIKQPTNWVALVRLIEILRRTGNLEEAPEYLNNSDVVCSNMKSNGLTYCKALYQWYSGNLNSALRNFNAVRQDPEWGLQALYNMIEICLNPDNEMLGDEMMDNDDLEYRDSRSMALKTADRLLKELKQRLDSNSSDTLKYRLLVNFRLLVTKEKHNIERALEDFVTITTQSIYKDHIGPILGMATAYTFLKQSQRAKNQLKRVVKNQWTFEDADYLERCWLLLADYYIQSSKMEQATDLLNKVVYHNKSCSKAYEYLGFIAEKEQNYKNSTQYYERVWKFGRKLNAPIGYKLAYSYMKLKKYPDAIDTAKEVLKLNPDYPKLKKDILDKCINNLRT